MIDAPFFKCHPNQWLTGRISFEPLDVQGAFWKLCCYYWSKECKLPISQLKKIIPYHYDYLIENDFIKLVNDETNIDWLDKQINEFRKRRNVNAENGRKGGLAKARNSLSIKKRKENTKDPYRCTDSISKLAKEIKERNDS